jgi:ABC-type branched-subunit amino acid transport system substrate-binding protein
MGAVGYSTYAATDPQPMVQNWIKKWQTAMNRPNEAPDAYVTATYDAILVLAKVLNEAKSLLREDIKNAFLGVQNMETISGVVRWNDVGDITRDKPVMVEVSDNGILIPWP